MHITMIKYILTLLVSALVASVSLHADTFGTGANQFTIDFTSIGNAGNAADPLTGYGSVGYNYRIGTYAISQNQVDAATASGLAHVNLGDYSGDEPASPVTWYESAAFVNWLNVSKGFQPAYNLTWSGSTWSMALWIATDTGYDANNLYRNSLAKYFLPSENEFYKAAYGKSDGNGYYLYPTARDTAPTAVLSGTTEGTAVFVGNGVTPQQPASVYLAGGLSSYGTMGQGGNVAGWIESALDGNNDSATEGRVIKGGCAGNSDDAQLSANRTSWIWYPDHEDSGIGFRVASVDIGSIPEPSTYALFGIGAFGVLMVMRRKKNA